jgi:TolB-like protein/DNA-binding winged helix-turn-helix (wHTH) protein/Flp pilus assembly protein TadD
MLETARLRRTIHFAEYEVDLRTAEVRKNGSRIKLEGQPFQILALLLERTGELVTRDEVKQRLWGGTTFVDFERCINEAVKRLREALDDSADRPRYVETLRGRGYRFIYPLATAHTKFLGGRTFLALSVATLVLLAAIVIGVRSRSSGNAAAEIRSLAVLPLTNLSGDPEQDYFADGVTDAIITELGKITSLRVISRQSVMQYRSTNKSISEIARDLNIDAVVEGTVIREHDRVSVTAQLIQARPERHVWAERYDRQLNSILALQSDVAHGIAGEIRAKLTVPEQSKLTSTRAVNPQAYEAYLKGLYHIDKPGREGVRKSSEYFRRAIDIDPTYAPAWAALADTYNRGAIRGFQPPLEAYPLAKAAVAKALSFDNRLPEAYVLAGVIKFRFDWDWAGADRDLKRALQLNSSSSRAHVAYATYLLAMRQFDAAINEAQRALDLDPFAPQRHLDLAWKLYFAGQHDAAISRLRKMLELMRDSALAYATLARSYTAKGLHREAIAACRQALSLPGDAEVLSVCGAVYAKGGRKNEAREILARLLADPGTSPYQIAFLYDALGDTNEALRWLDRAFKARTSEMFFMRITPFSSSLRAEPRFQDVVRRMDFPQ